MLCEPSLSAGATVCLLLKGGTIRIVGPELQDAFYRLIWHEYGLRPNTIEALRKKIYWTKFDCHIHVVSFDVFLITYTYDTYLQFDH